MGYIGYSMSERAYQAYKSGEKPRSKWTKTDLIDSVTSFNEYTEEDLKPFSTEVLKRYFLTWCSWHHTGKLYNETSFYDIDEDKAAKRDMDSLTEMADLVAGETRKEKTLVKAHIYWEEWEGSRNYGSFTDYDSPCIIVGKWAYLPDGSKKNVDGRHVHRVERFQRAPRGQASVYRKIMRSLPASLR